MLFIKSSLECPMPTFGTLSIMHALQASVLRVISDVHIFSGSNTRSSSKGHVGALSIALDFSRTT